MEKMMVNHPTRSQKSQDAAIRRLLIKHQLSEITMTVSSDIVGVRAHPASYSPIIAERRTALLESRDWSMGDLEKLHAETRRPVAFGSGKTIEEAIGNLAAKLASPSGL